MPAILAALIEFITKNKRLMITAALFLALAVFVVWHNSQIAEMKQTERDVRDAYWEDRIAHAPAVKTGTETKTLYLPLPTTHVSVPATLTTDTTGMRAIVDSLKAVIARSEAARDSVLQALTRPRTGMLVKKNEKGDTLARVDVKYTPLPYHRFDIDLAMSMRVDSIIEHWEKPVLKPEDGGTFWKVTGYTAGGAAAVLIGQAIYRSLKK